MFSGNVYCLGTFISSGESKQNSDVMPLINFGYNFLIFQYFSKPKNTYSIFLITLLLNLNFYSHTFYCQQRDNQMKLTCWIRCEQSYYKNATYLSFGWRSFVAKGPFVVALTLSWAFWVTGDLCL